MNLVDAITPTAAEYTMLTTFPFDARFYSEYLSREFSDAGVASPVILMDQDRYQRNLHEGTWQPGSIGGSYYLEPIDVEQVFHPKVAVSTSEDTIDVAVSSANLTLDELTSAAQLGMEYTLTRDDADDDPHTPVIQDILSFVDELQEEYVGRDAGTQLSRLVEQGSWIHDVSATNETTQFLQNLTTPILPQIVETLDAVDRVQLAAPFFGSAETMQTIVAQIDPVECELLIDEGTTHIDLEAVIDAIDRPVTIRQLDYAASRWIHAKWIGFQGTDWSGCFYGSPNMTGSALLSSASTGNLEAGLLRTESNRGYFDDGPPLFNTEQFDVSLTGAVDADTVTTNSYANLDTSTNESAVDLQLQDIFIQSESEDTANLELTLDAPTPASLREQTATLTTLTADEHNA